MERDPFELVGDTIDGQFQVIEVAGEGSLSIVYRGHHVGVDAPVAIKCLNLPQTLDAALVQPLVESFREASKLHYRLARGNLNIAQTIASGATLAPRTGTTVPYLVREWFDGESLAGELARRRSEGLKGRTTDEMLAMLEAAFDAIAYAHAQGVVHSALNPTNFFLATHDDKRTLKVLDFGVARTMNQIASELPPDSRPLSDGLQVFFPAYAAPEQLDRTLGEVGPSTDVYTLALVIMELLSDRVVMTGSETPLLVERALDENRRPTPRAHGLRLPRNLELVLTRAVARTPSLRQKSAGDLWREVKAALRPMSLRSAPGTSAAAGAPPMSDSPAAKAPAPAPLPARVLTPAPAPAAAPAPEAAAAPVPVPAPAPEAAAAPEPAPAGAAAAAAAAAPLPAFDEGTVPSLPVAAAADATIETVPPNEATAPAGMRPRAATLVGMAPLPTVAGAVGRPRLVVGPATNAGTVPMSFEPGSSQSSAAPVAPTPARRSHPPPPFQPAPSARPGSVRPGPMPTRTPLPQLPPSTPPPAPAQSTALPPVAIAQPMPAVLPSASPAGGVPVSAGAPAPARAPMTPPVTAPTPMPVPAAFPIPEKDAARRPSRVALYGVVSGVIGLVLAIVVIAVASRRHDQSSADSAMASASAAPPQAAPSAAPEPAQSSSAPAASAEPPAKFNAKKARGALDKTWKQITHCRKGKAVGVGMTTVTFDNDGSVANVVVGPPFKGTPTATCVAEAMSTAHMQPFVGHPGVVTYRIFIAAH